LVRTFGASVPKGSIYAINPFMIMFLTPVRTHRPPPHSLHTDAYQLTPHLSRPTTPHHGG
jgi:hypothetical protein